jgi:hypothetical protein
MAGAFESAAMNTGYSGQAVQVAVEMHHGTENSLKMNDLWCDAGNRRIFCRNGQEDRSVQCLVALLTYFARSNNAVARLWLPASHVPMFITSLLFAYTRDMIAGAQPDVLAGVLVLLRHYSLDGLNFL